MSKRKLTYKDFKQYFSNSVQKKDKHAFEKQMMQDAFEEEAFDGLSKLSNNELEQDISELKIDINRRVIQTRRIIPVWFRYAASVIILIGIGTSIYLLNNRFWQDTMLRQQISEEMEIADSILIESEQEIKQFVEKIASESFRKDTSLDLAEELIADNRKKEVKKTIVVVDDDIDIENDKMISDAFVTETDEAIELDAILDIVEFEEEEELVYDEIEIIAENIVETEKLEQALQGKVSGVEIRGVAKSSAVGTRPASLSADLSAEQDGKADPAGGKRSKRKAEENIAEQEKEVAKRVITGKVLGAEDNLSIPGVSIVIEDNPSIGTTTNIDGEFALTISDDDEELKTLIAAFVGMETLEITIEGDTNILVYMESDVMEMDEVIVTAYGVSAGKQDYSEIERIEAKPPNSLGIAKYKKQLIESLDYSKLSDSPGKHKIKFSFTVNANGKLSNFDFIKSSDVAFNDEIIRVMKEMGNWIPATENNQDIRSTVKFTLKIII